MARGGRSRRSVRPALCTRSVHNPAGQPPAPKFVAICGARATTAGPRQAAGRCYTPGVAREPLGAVPRPSLPATPPRSRPPLPMTADAGRSGPHRSELRGGHRPTYELWLAPLRPVAIDGDTRPRRRRRPCAPGSPSRFAACSTRAAARVLGPEGASSSAATGAHRPARAARAPGAPAADRGADRDGLNPKFTFEQFVIGDGNRFAHAAALAVAELPGQAYNPLFVYGPPGVGKTHLLHSIGNYVNAYGGGAHRPLHDRRGLHQRVPRAPCARRGRAPSRGASADGDVLLIDDVQFLEPRRKTEEEFFHTFNALHDAGGQLVLTSDRLPRDLDALEDRLRERFEAGLVAEIAPPDLRHAHDRAAQARPPRRRRARRRRRPRA